jgi:hypothetical protein
VKQRSLKVNYFIFKVKMRKEGKQDENNDREDKKYEWKRNYVE